MKQSPVDTLLPGFINVTYFAETKTGAELLNS